MIKQLKKIIDEMGIVFVSEKLGYRSFSTIYTWLREKRIPKKNEIMVRDFIQDYNSWQEISKK